MTKRQNRMILVALLVLGISLAGYLGVKALVKTYFIFIRQVILRMVRPQLEKVLELVDLLRLIVLKEME